jgi:hypothetical protein
MEKQAEIAKYFEAKVKFFLQASDVQHENAQKNKTINAQKEESKTFIMNYMKSNRLTCLPVDGKFLVLKTKNTKHSMNAEFLRECFNAFVQKQTSPTQILGNGERFAQFCAAMQNELSSSSFDISIEQTMPICMRLSTVFETK